MFGEKEDVCQHEEYGPNGEKKRERKRERVCVDYRHPPAVMRA